MQYNVNAVFQQLKINALPRYIHVLLKCLFKQKMFYNVCGFKLVSSQKASNNDAITLKKNLKNNLVSLIFCIPELKIIDKKLEYVDMSLQSSNS